MVTWMCRAVVLFVLLLAPSCASADDTGEDPPRGELGKLIGLGEAALREGDVERARGLFVQADAIDLFEAPNYEALPALAESECRLGALGKGLSLLDELQCMLDVEVGRERCFGPSVPGELGPKNPHLTPLCFERMCSELFLSYYENPTAMMLDRVKRLRERAARAREHCQLDQE